MSRLMAGWLSCPGQGRHCPFSSCELSGGQAVPLHVALQGTGDAVLFQSLLPLPVGPVRTDWLAEVAH